jgi:hypothetical protein
MRKLPIPTLLVTALVLGGCAGGLSGCSRDGSGGAAGAAATSGLPAGPSAEDAEHFRQFAQCMREHGVQVADPEPGRGFAIPTPRDDDPAVGVALDSCSQLLPNGGEPPQPSPEELDDLLRFARCMREHGVDIPDPDSKGRIHIDNPGGNELDTPARQEAAQACTATPTGGDR